MAVACLDESMAAKVLRQVEFYFSDSNLPRDKFLRETVNKSEDGLVSLALICSFARMRNHLGLGDVKGEGVPEEMVLAVAETLRKSTLLKVSEDGKKVGRTTELSKPEEVIEQVDSRTVAASPLPYDVTIEDMQSIFGQHGKVNSVRLPRRFRDKRYFCGTALIEFSEEEDANKVLSASMVFAGAELEMKPKKDFDAERRKKWEDIEKAHNTSTNGGYPKGLIVSFKLKNITPEGSIEENGQSAEVNNEVPDTKGKVTEIAEMKTSENDVDDEGKSAEHVEKGNGEKVNEDLIEETNKKADNALQGEVKGTNGLSVEGGEKNANLADNENVVAREDLKKIFQKFGNVKFVDFRMSEKSGYIRFEDPDSAVKVRAAAVFTDEGGFIVKNHIATVEALCGDAEKEYWSKLRGNQEKYRENKGNNYRGRGRGSKVNRQTDGKRQRQADSFSGRPNKAQKVLS
ncbi:uncharacterized protein A4U43_C10F4650 [Asparagus officinalis]|uniref:La protein 1 n=1 Tax=Asparagus officinalis TaxID=4686 RepID=A0A5P1E151_ASPOF|nr:la protein 1-like [Asparagus officinalis]ONK56149.1 uncharacterized protein A4U43_C10F4650 [Asparagus officinalis]